MWPLGMNELYAEDDVERLMMLLILKHIERRHVNADQLRNAAPDQPRENWRNWDKSGLSKDAGPSGKRCIELLILLYKKQEGVARMLSPGQGKLKTYIQFPLGRYVAFNLAPGYRVEALPGFQGMLGRENVQPPFTRIETESHLYRSLIGQITLLKLLVRSHYQSIAVNANACAETVKRFHV